MNTNTLYELTLPLMVRNMVPDWLIGWAARRGTEAMLNRWRRLSPADQRANRLAFIEQLRASPIAIHTGDANEQHYELPAKFFELVLGPRLKYSSGYWTDSETTLAEAEETMLQLTADRARLGDGQRILELGCGWGSLCLWLAERYPNSEIMAVSNSHTQGEYIAVQIAERGITNLDVTTADMNYFDTDLAFDRVVSIEMFEHMKNYEALLAKIAGWLRSNGMLFVHIFTHREYAYGFEVGEGDWMTEYFFAGGNMPSDDLLAHFQRDLILTSQWEVNGTHYERTLRAWLKNYDGARERIRQIMADTYGETQADRWLVNWRLFFLGCAEVFGLRRGSEYRVSHYLFEK